MGTDDSMSSSTISAGWDFGAAFERDRTGAGVDAEPTEALLCSLGSNVSSGSVVMFFLLTSTVGKSVPCHQTARANRPAC
jgi:hypothetical protein